MLLKKLYQTTDTKKAQAIWIKRLDNLSTKTPLVLGIPSDNGGGIQRGANWGPLAVRMELLKTDSTFHDLGDVRVIPHLLHDDYLNQETISKCRKSLYGKNIKLPVSPLSMSEKVLSELYKKFPSSRVFGIGGDHSTSYPLVKEWLKSRKAPQKAALIHFDAHTDLSASRLGIDLCFGTWTYQILKYLASSNHIIQLGIRSSAHNKSYWKKNLGVEQLWSKEINRLGVEKTYGKVKSHLKKLNIEEIYISFDIDALDFKYASATGTPEKEGLQPSTCAALIRLLSEDFKITGADIMEVAPYVLPEGAEARDQKSSVAIAGQLSALLIEVLSK